MNEKEIRRGEIWYVKQSNNVVGSEMHAGRPAVVVSNNYNNANSPVCQVVYLTTQEKKPLPTHVLVDDITSGLREPSTALCEQITKAGKERIAYYIGRVSDATMEEIDEALMIQLDLERYTVPRGEQCEVEESVSRPLALREKEEILHRCKSLEAELEMSKKMLDFYKSQYEGFVNKIIEKI